jgi:hypothetical protein
VAGPGAARPDRSPLVSRADRRRQLVAFGAVCGLLVSAFGLWAVAILTSDDRLGIAAAPSPAAEPPPEDDGGDPAGRSDEPEPGSEDGDPVDDELTPVTIDGVCTVELPSIERDAPRSAWEYPDCTYAPVAVQDRRERWIVVRASMGSADFDADEAEQRAGELGVDGGVLWSSHYPSLNPDLWVVFDGPFPDAAAARGAADLVDGEAYARALTTDENDRFCIAADGCVGERAD